MNVSMTMLALLFLLFQDDPGRLIEALRSGDVEQREAALRRLKDLGEKAVPALKEALNDPDQEVAGRARFLLQRASVAARVGDALRQAVPGIEDRLAAGDHAWTQVWMDLAKRGDEENPPQLLEPLAAPGVRGARTEAEKVWACRTAANQGYASAALEIVRFLEDPSDSVKATAVQALVQLRSPEIFPALVLKIRDGSEDLRQQAEQILMLMASNVPPAKLVELVKSDLPRLRAAGLRALSGAGEAGPEAAAAVAAALGDADAGVRLAALQVVGGARAPECVPKILPLLKDPDIGVRVAAVGTLAAVGAREQAAAVQALLTDADANVRLAVLQALTQLGATGAAGAIAARVRDGDRDVRREAARALVGLGATGSASSLRPLLKDESDELRLIALWALGHLGASDAAAEILPFLGHADTPYRASAAAALGRLGSAAAVDPLRRALEDKSAIVRICAAEALGRLRTDVDRTELLAMLSDGNAAVRASAARALADLGASEAVPLLENLLEDVADIDEAEDAEIDRLERHEGCPELSDRYDRIRGAVKGAAADALCRIGFREGVPALIEAVDDDYEAASLTSLNAFRRPEQVRRLRETRLAADLAGSPVERLRRIAAEAGLDVKMEDLRSDGEGAIPAPLKADGARTLWDALLATTEACPLDVVVDRRRVRIVQDSEVVEFWSLWWESEKED